jgi:hypothetical protein
MTDNSRSFSLLTIIADGEHVKSYVSSLAINSFNMAVVVLFNNKLLPMPAAKSWLSETRAEAAGWGSALDWTVQGVPEDVQQQPGDAQTLGSRISQDSWGRVDGSGSVSRGSGW